MLEFKRKKSLRNSIVIQKKPGNPNAVLVWREARSTRWWINYLQCRCTIKNIRGKLKTNKEMKQEYKLYKSKKGVYQIKNIRNGKILIGSSTDLVAIWNRQKTQLNFGNHPNKELQKEWNDLGPDAFEYEMLSEIKEEEIERDYKNEAKELAELFIQEIKPFGEKGYNKE